MRSCSWTAQRRAEVKRTTNETDIALLLDLDGARRRRRRHRHRLPRPHARCCSPTTAASTSRCGASGDLDVDGHHTVEDIGLALGQALREALGDKRGIRRYGSFLLPMDEALAMVALDLSGRPFFAHDLQLAGVRIGEFDADLTPHFFRSLATQAA